MHKLFFIDNTGNTVIDLVRYENARSFSDGLAAIRDSSSRGEGRWGFIDKNGEIIIPPQFIEVRSFSGGMALVKLKEGFRNESNDKWGFVDKTGHIAFEVDFDEVSDFSEGVAIGKKDNEFSVIDKSGLEISTFSSEHLEIDFHKQKFFNGLITACETSSDKCGFIDKTGEFVIAPSFVAASGFSEGLARVAISKNNREMVGFIDKDSNYIIPPKFDIDGDFDRSSTDFSEGLASLVDGKTFQYLYIDKSGNIAFQTNFMLPQNFKNGLASVYDEKSNKYGYINKKGELVIPAKFNYAGNFTNDLALVEVD